MKGSRMSKWLYYLAYQYKSKKDVQGAINAEKCLELFPNCKGTGELGMLYEEMVPLKSS
jgi:hypothetical protein